MQRGSEWGAKTEQKNCAAARRLTLSVFLRIDTRPARAVPSNDNMSAPLRNKPVNVVVVGDARVGKTALITAAATEGFAERPPPTLPPTRLPADATPEGVPLVLTDTSSREEDRAVTEAALRAADAVVVAFDVGEIGGQSMDARVRALGPSTGLRAPRPGAAHALQADRGDTRDDWGRRAWKLRGGTRDAQLTGRCPSPSSPHPPTPHTPARPDTLDRVSSHWMPELARLGVAAPTVLVGCKADAAPTDAARLTAVVAPVMHRHKQIETCLECSAKKLVFVGEVSRRKREGR